MPSPERARAESIGYLVHPWDAQRGRVHSAYRGAVNVAIGDDWWSVLPADLPDGPGVVRLPQRAWRSVSARVRSGDAVAVRGAAIRLGDAVIDLRTVPVWRPRPLPVLVPGIARRSEALLAAALARGGAPWIPAAIGSALESDDPAPAVSALLGRGTGLTPAGDDALLGAIAACWCLRAAHPVAAANHARLAPAVSQRLAATTDLSAALLRQAAAGHYSRPVHDALAALLGGGAMDDLQLFTVGATSGADCALGIAAAVDHIIGRQPDKVTA